MNIPKIFVACLFQNSALHGLTLEGPSHKISLRPGRIAQLGERRPYKPEVAGSIPVPPTIRLQIVEFGLRNSI